MLELSHIVFEGGTTRHNGSESRYIFDLFIVCFYRRSIYDHYLLTMVYAGKDLRRGGLGKRCFVHYRGGGWR
jgi:hypothetical protein